MLPTTSFAGHINGQPTLKPGSNYYCPSQVNDYETLTFSCNDSRIIEIEWIVEEGYIQEELSIKFIAALGVTQTSQIIIGSFTGSLVNITDRRGDFANMITKLMVDIHGLNNDTNITCRTLGITGHYEYASSVIYFPGLKCCCA